MRTRFRLWKYLLICLIPAGFSGLTTASPFNNPTDNPEVNAIDPASGPTTPGSKVTAYGRGFSPSTIVYFGGLQVRETKFISPSRLEVVTPYLRPGVYKLQLKTLEAVVQSEVTFTAVSSGVDKEFDRALSLAKAGQPNTSISLLKNIATSAEDYQVRAYAHYQASKIYFMQGDLWRWGGEASSIFDSADRSGPAVQTSWHYRLSLAQSDYLLPTGGSIKHDLTMSDWMVEKDVTQDPEPRFFRSLVNARHGNLDKARADLALILTSNPDKSSYQALAAYVAAIAGNKPQLQPFWGQRITDDQAISLLGQAAYLSGDFAGAQEWWGVEARVFPLGASLAYLAGKKHLAYGENRVAAALLAECAAIAPDTKEGREARDLLVGLNKSP